MSEVAPPRMKHSTSWAVLFDRQSGNKPAPNGGGRVEKRTRNRELIISRGVKIGPPFTWSAGYPFGLQSSRWVFGSGWCRLRRMPTRVIQDEGTRRSNAAPQSRCSRLHKTLGRDFSDARDRRFACRD